jgi:hypothetical protein
VSVSTEALAARSDHLWSPTAGSNTTVIEVCFRNGSLVERQAIQTVVENSWERIPLDLAQTEIWGQIGWGSQYGVDFQGWGDCPVDTLGRIISINLNNPAIDAAGVVHGHLGRGALSRDPSVEFRTGSPSIRTIIHEFGHVLGFAHEFVRSDYASVDPTCAATGGTAADIALTGPDVTSIMNYLSCGAGRALDHEDQIGFSHVYGPALIEYGNLVALRGVDGRLLSLNNTDTTVMRIDSYDGQSGFVMSGDQVVFSIDGQPFFTATLSGTQRGHIGPGAALGVNDSLLVNNAFGPVQLIRVDGVL